MEEDQWKDWTRSYWSLRLEKLDKWEKNFTATLTATGQMIENI